MHVAAMLDFDLGLTKVPPSFCVGEPISGGVPDDLSECELRISDLEIKWNVSQISVVSTVSVVVIATGHKTVAMMCVCTNQVV